jgi:hypothetical protein
MERRSNPTIIHENRDARIASSNTFFGICAVSFGTGMYFLHQGQPLEANISFTISGINLILGLEARFGRAH